MVISKQNWLCHRNCCMEEQMDGKTKREQIAYDPLYIRKEIPMAEEVIEETKIEGAVSEEPASSSRENLPVAEN